MKIGEVVDPSQVSVAWSPMTRLPGAEILELSELNLSELRMIKTPNIHNHLIKAQNTHGFKDNSALVNC